MIVIAAFVGGYILSHENLKLPSWVPVLGKSYFTLKGDFQTAQAVTPGQGQAVTIAGAKIGEIASVDLKTGSRRSRCTWSRSTRERRLYKNATMLLRPKTQLKDETVEVDPGTPASGALHQRRDDPAFADRSRRQLRRIPRDARRGIARLPAGAARRPRRRAEEQRAAAVGGVQALRPDRARPAGDRLAARGPPRGDRALDPQLPAAAGSGRRQGQAVGGAGRLRPTPCSKSSPKGQERAEHAAAAARRAHQDQGGPRQARHGREPGRPHAQGAAAVREGDRSGGGSPRELALKTTPIFKNEIRPFARQILPVINQIEPATKELSEAFPKLASSFTVLNELFNEFAYNPGSKQGGFLFFLDWANHDFNSARQHRRRARPARPHPGLLQLQRRADPEGGRGSQPDGRLLLGLLNPPTGAACSSSASVKAASAAHGAGAHDELDGPARRAHRRRVRPEPEPAAASSAVRRPRSPGEVAERCRSAPPRWATSS